MLRFMARLLRACVLVGLWSHFASPACQAQTLTHPVAPTNLVATAASPTQINLSWSEKSKNATGFTIKRLLGTVPHGYNIFVPIATIGNVTSYQDTTAQPDTTYSYKVSAFNGAGSSSYSDPASATTPQNTTSTPVVLPIEVLGATGATQTITVSVPAGQGSQVTGLWMQVHGLSYADKASVQVNNSGWVALDNNTVVVADPGKSYGGIGGGFATLKLTLPLAGGAVTDGSNTISFKFNGTDGVSMGFRVLAFNFLTSAGVPVLPGSTFTQDDPNAWQPPSNDSANIAAGQSLWHTATLSFSPLNSATMQAHCADCHTQDGRDLKYFNYSNLSIIERAKFHGLTQTQGQQIASYIRSLNVQNPGRPWNPPYQPGPGMDSQTTQNWAAGAGLSAVLDNDQSTFSYLFPNGVAVSTNATQNLRELPISFQLPDWNHWLPRIHPKDAWGTAFTSSSFLYAYDGEGTGSSVLAAPIRTLLANGQSPDSFFKVDLTTWFTARLNFLTPLTRPVQNIAWSPSYSEKVYSTALWHLVKTFELMQEFGMEGYGPAEYGAQAEARTWYTLSAEVAFNTSPHILGIPDDQNGLHADKTLGAYLANAWYELQILLDNGNRKRVDWHPVDYPYTYGLIKDLNVASSVPEALRFVSVFVKGMQNADNGQDPTNPQTGWNPIGIADISQLVHPAQLPMWQATPTSTRTAIMQALLSAWFAKCRQYSPQQYYQGSYNGAPLADPGYVPASSPTNPDGNWADKMWYMIPQFRRYGVDGTLLNSVCDWAKTLWPNANWDALKA